MLDSSMSVLQFQMMHSQIWNLTLMKRDGKLRNKKSIKKCLNSKFINNNIGFKLREDKFKLNSNSPNVENYANLLNAISK